MIDTKKILTILLLIMITSLLIVTSVQALTVVKINNDLYNITLDNGRKLQAYNIVYITNTKQLTMNVNTTDHRGLRIIDMIEIRDYALQLKGKPGQAERTTMYIR